jgi:predicted nucleic acid-binding protein
LILADSSVWIDHLRRPNPQLISLLEKERMVGHPFVTGEVSLGSIATRNRVIAKLGELPQLQLAPPVRVAALIATHSLWGRGIGYVDAHLLAAVRLTPGASLWSRDRRLRLQAERLGVAFVP